MRLVCAVMVVVLVGVAMSSAEEHPPVARLAAIFAAVFAAGFVFGGRRGDS